jgi:hypothetical protein
MFKLIGIVAFVILGCALLAWLSGQTRRRRALQGDVVAAAAIRAQKLCWADKVPLGLAGLLVVFSFLVLVSGESEPRYTLVTDPAVLKRMQDEDLLKVPTPPPGYVLDRPVPQPRWVLDPPIGTPSRLEQVGVFMWRVSYMLILPLWAFLRLIDLLSGGPTQRHLSKRWVTADLLAAARPTVPAAAKTGRPG